MINFHLKLTHSFSQSQTQPATLLARAWLSGLTLDCSHSVALWLNISKSPQPVRARADEEEQGGEEGEENCEGLLARSLARW